MQLVNQNRLYLYGVEITPDYLNSPSHYDKQCFGSDSK